MRKFILLFALFAFVTVSFAETMPTNKGEPIGLICWHFDVVFYQDLNISSIKNTKTGPVCNVGCDLVKNRYENKVVLQHDYGLLRLELLYNKKNSKKSRHNFQWRNKLLSAKTK